MFSGTAQVSHQVCQFFFVSSVFILMCVTVMDINKAVVCCLQATSAMFSVSQSSGNDLYASMNTRVTSLILILEGGVP